MLFELAFVWLKILVGGLPIMPKKKYTADPNGAGRELLRRLLRSGKHPTRKVTRAPILLKAADGRADEQIATALGVGRATVERARQSFVERRLEAYEPSSLYEAFEPAEARRILRKINFHYTPKRGSCLNMAEIELGILPRQCLDRRLPDEPTLKQEVASWEERRNEQKATIDWRFSLDNAGIELKRLYPSIS